MTPRQIHAVKLFRLVRIDAIRSVSFVSLFLCLISYVNASESVPKWGRFEITLTNTTPCSNPAQDIQITAEFRSPSGGTSIVNGFWDGGLVWRIRFSPNEIGEWQYSTQCPGTADLHNRRGAFQCIPNTNQNLFTVHGPVKVSNHGRALAHEDGTPFFWMADTTRNGPLLSDAKDWDKYLYERVRQKFTTIQWTAIPRPESSPAVHNGLIPFSGHDKISINPEYFKILDGKLDAINASGLLAAPMLFRAGSSSTEPNHAVTNPFLDLPEDEAILLTRYMVARWGANSVIWILNGNGGNQSSNANRMRNISRATFGDRRHAPVALSSGAMQSISKELIQEKWMDILGYQTEPGTNENATRGCYSGPQTSFWTNQPFRPIINLGPVVESNSINASGMGDSSFAVRRAMYWSLLSTPTAGVAYGNQSVLDWNSSASALTTPGAEQVAHLVQFFTSIQFWRLLPSQDMLAADPGSMEARRHIAAARTQEGDVAVIYVPEDRSFQIRLKDLPPSVEMIWTDPRNGSKRRVVGVLNGENIQIATPGPGDWLLLLKSETK